MKQDNIKNVSHDEELTDKDIVALAQIFDLLAKWDFEDKQSKQEQK